jgi:DNA-binding MarR family transcriptional regulator
MAALAEVGISVKQYGALAILVDLGARSQRALGSIQGVDRTTMVAIVDGLEADGFVERRRDPADRRSYALHPTAAGRRALPTAERAIEAAEREFLAPLAAAERRRLKELLRRLL